MSDILDIVDVDRLRSEVQTKYREVAQAPSAEYHFHTGRAHALRMGYLASPLDRLPEEACEAFAGVANPFHWGPPQPGERVVDLDTFAGATGEEQARTFGTLGYSIRARKPE